MKTKKSFIIMLAAFSMSCATVSAQENVKKEEKREQQETKRQKKTVQEVVFKVNMTCENCKAKIEKNVAWEKGVRDLVVNLNRKLVTIKYDASKTDEETLKKAIEALGYTAEKQETAAQKK